MITQDSHHGGRCQRVTSAGEQVLATGAAASPETDGVAGFVDEVVGDVEVGRVRSLGQQGRADVVVVCANAVGVGEGAAVLDLLNHPLAADSFQYIGLCRIGNDEAVLIVEAAKVAAVAALAMAFQQLDNHRHGGLGGGGAFQT